MTESEPLLDQFIGTRAQLREIASEKNYYGWVKGVQKNQLLIFFAEHPVFTVGQSLELLMSSHLASSKFTTKFLGLSGELQVFETPAVVRMSPPKGILRKESPIKKTTLKFLGKSVNALVLDIARTGFAIQFGESLEPGLKVSAHFISSEGNDVNMEASVVYCKFDQETQLFRIGFEQSYMGRVDLARWQILLSSPGPISTTTRLKSA